MDVTIEKVENKSQVKSNGHARNCFAGIQYWHHNMFQLSNQG